MATVTNTRCPRCNGRGGWAGWPGYTCFACGGTGRTRLTASVRPARAAGAWAGVFMQGCPDCGVWGLGYDLYHEGCRAAAEG